MTPSDPLPREHATEWSVGLAGCQAMPSEGRSRRPVRRDFRVPCDRTADEADDILGTTTSIADCPLRSRRAQTPGNAKEACLDPGQRQWNLSLRAVGHSQTSPTDW